MAEEVAELQSLPLPGWVRMKMKEQLSLMGFSANTVGPLAGPSSSRTPQTLSVLKAVKCKTSRGGTHGEKSLPSALKTLPSALKALPFSA